MLLSLTPVYSFQLIFLTLEETQQLHVFVKSEFQMHSTCTMIYIDTDPILGDGLM